MMFHGHLMDRDALEDVKQLEELGNSSKEDYYQCCIPKVKGLVQSHSKHFDQMTGKYGVRI